MARKVNGTVTFMRSNSHVTQRVVALPTPQPKRLGTLRSVRREMARVYLEARTGRLPTSEATRLTYILSALARTMEMEHAVPVQAGGRHASAETPELDQLIARLCEEATRAPEPA